MRARSAHAAGVNKDDSRKARVNRELTRALYADSDLGPDNRTNYLECFLRAAAPFFPNAVRTRDGRFAMVFFFLAAAAAFFIFLRAAARCLSVAIFSHPSSTSLRPDRRPRFRSFRQQAHASRIPSRACSRFSRSSRHAFFPDAGPR